MKKLFIISILFSLNAFANECIDLTKCVEHISKLTGKKYIYEESLKGGLQASSNFQITSENADTVFTSVLSANGYSRVPTNEKDTFKIVNSRDIRYETLPSINADKNTKLQVPNNDDYYMMFFKFKNYKHGQLRMTGNGLRPFMSRYGRIIETGDLLAVQEKASKLQLVYEIAKNNDRELSKDEILKWEIEEKERQAERKAMKNKMREEKTQEKR
ncbi:MAG: hypothetical protein ACXVLQ_03785 [Bacteriovorax sp.]